MDTRLLPPPFISFPTPTNTSVIVCVNVRGYARPERKMETETETAKGKWSSESGGGDLQCFSLLANETDKDVYPHHSLSWAVQVTKR